jgi:antitoxin CcdA
MLSLYNQQAPKKPTNLSINTDLLKQAREFDLNLSAVLEQALIERLTQKQRKRWLADIVSPIMIYTWLMVKLILVLINHKVVIKQTAECIVLY